MITTIFPYFTYAAPLENKARSVVSDESSSKTEETIAEETIAEEIEAAVDKVATDKDKALETEQALLDKVTDKKVKQEIIVKYKDGSFGSTQKLKQFDKVKNKLKLKKLKSKKNIKKSNIDLIEIDESDNILDTIKALKEDPDILYVQPNYAVKMLGTPEDEYFNQQWSLKNVGQEIRGSKGIEGFDINVVSAWDKTIGSENIIVGVLDTGIDISHVDLKDSIYVNEKEIPGNGIDDDKNSYIDDVNGWNFHNDSNVVYDAGNDAHGTAIAGLIAAQANKTGIQGVAPKIKILPLSFMNEGKGYTFDIIEAIDYAKSLNVNIINCSWGSDSYNIALRNAMVESDILFLCAAGNDGEETAVYPAAYNLTNTVSVGSIDNSGNISSISNYGGLVDVYAPGVDLISTKTQDDYAFFTGTSFSTALVTGIASLLKSYKPDLTSKDIAYTIKKNVKRQGIAGYGLVDAALALDNIMVYEGDDDPVIVDEDAINDEVGNLGAEIDKSLLEQLHFGVDGVNPATGNFSRSYVDMSMTTVGPDINITRTYNSRGGMSNRHFGIGWTFGYEGSVKTDSNNSLRQVVTLPGGSVETFLPYGEEGVYISDYSSGSRNTLSKSDGIFKLTTKDQTVYEFNSKGWLASIKDRNGNYITIVTDELGKVQTITDQTGRKFTVTYGSKYIEKVTDNTSGRVVTYQYNTSNLLYKVIDPMNNTVYTYEYDSSRFLTSIKDADLKEIEKLVYDHTAGDKKDKVTKHTIYTTDTIYNTYTYDYYVNGKFTYITDLEGKKTTKWYDEQYNIAASVDPEGKTTSAQYYVSEGNVEWNLSTSDKGTGRINFPMVTLNNKMYVLGGKISMNGFTISTNDAQVYNPSTKRWSSIRDIPQVYEGDVENGRYDTENEYGRASAGAAVLNGQIYLAGGINRDSDMWGFKQTTLKSVIKYNPSTNSWTPVASLNYERSGLSLVELGGYLYAISGNSVEKYNPTSNSWTYIPCQGYDCNKAIVCNGKIYGIDSQYRLLEFNTTSNKWSVVASNAPSGWMAVRNNKLISINETTGIVLEFDLDKKWWTPVASLAMPKMTGYSIYGGIVCNDKIYTFLCRNKYAEDDANYVIEGVWDDTIKINRYGEIKSITDRTGNKYQYDIDGMGNIIKITNPDSSTRVYTYDEKNNLLTEKDEESKYTFYIYDADKINLVKKVQPLSGEINYVEGINDSLFAITKYQYYAPENCYGFKGMLYKTIDPEGHETTYTYNTKGDVATVTDGELKKITYGYSNIGLLTSEKTGKGYTTQYEYDLNGRVVRITLQGGETTRIVYDSMGRKVKEVSAKLYNSTLDGLNSTPKTYTYTGNHGERTTYYRSGLVSQQTDSEGNITKYNYDRYGNLSVEQKPDPNGVITTPSGAVYEYKYDGINRLKELRYKETASATAYKTLVKYEYLNLEDGNTQKIQTTYLNDTQTAVEKTTYDFANRVLETVKPDLTSVGLTYYKNGMLKTQRDENGFITYCNYDTLNRLAEVWTPIEVSSGKVKYSYTKNTYYKNNLIYEELVAKEKVEYPNKGTSYVGKGYEYYKNGKVKKIFQDNKAKLYYLYDDDNNVSSEYVYTDGTNYMLTKYENNYFGKPSKKIQSVKKGDISGNTYTDATLIDLVTNYTFDKNGNIYTMTSPEGVVTTFGYDNLNRQTSAKYDDSYVDASETTVTGTITSSRAYNFEGKTVKETDANGNVTEYFYNKYGMLEKTTSKNVTVDGVKVDLVDAAVYDLGGRVIARISPKNYDSTKVYTALNRTEYNYDLMGRVVAEKQVYYDTATSAWINYISKAYKYDAAGNVSKELDAVDCQVKLDTFLKNFCLELNTFLLHTFFQQTFFNE